MITSEDVKDLKPTEAMAQYMKRFMSFQAFKLIQYTFPVPFRVEDASVYLLMYMHHVLTTGVIKHLDLRQTDRPQMREYIFSSYLLARRRDKVWYYELKTGFLWGLHWLQVWEAHGETWPTTHRSIQATIFPALEWRTLWSTWTITVDATATTTTNQKW